jgi:hypothetical protein
MAQGCHQIYSSSDREHFPPTVEPPDQAQRAADFTRRYGTLSTPVSVDQKIISADLCIDHEQAKRHKVGERYVEQHHIDTFEQHVRTMSKEDREFLAGLAAVKPDIQAALVMGLGNEMLAPEFAAELPGALRKILEKHPNAKGLFEKSGAGAQAWINTISNRGTNNAANGFAWEVIATARLMSIPIDNLQVFDSDHITFGWKAQARYGGKSGELITTDHEMGGFFSQPDRSTTEADLLIDRGWDETISIDFKRWSTSRDVPATQLQGLYVALTTGELTEAHIITTSQFGANTKAEVERLNEELEKLDCNPIELHENYQ